MNKNHYSVHATGETWEIRNDRNGRPVRRYQSPKRAEMYARLLNTGRRLPFPLPEIRTVRPIILRGAAAVRALEALQLRRAA